MDLTPDSQFGRYRIRRLIGRGGMGAVYEAVHSELGKRVALKTLSAGLELRSDARARFLREARAAARLEHPHVVGVSDVGEVNDVPFMVMDYLEGEDLQQLLDRERVLSVARVVEVVLPIASALAAAHEVGIVHRDIKPQNVFLARARQGGVIPKLLDFGISKITEADAPRGLTASVSLLGTPSYMSPEQVRGAKHVNARTDQYSLGVLAYQCASGRQPFEHTELYPLLAAISSGDYPALAGLCPELPPGFVSAIRQAMALEPGARFPSLLRLGAALVPFGTPETQARWRDSFDDRAIAAHGDTTPGSFPEPRSSSAPAGTPAEGGSPSIEATASTLSRGKGGALAVPKTLAALLALTIVGGWFWRSSHLRPSIGGSEDATASHGVAAAPPFAAPTPAVLPTDHSGAALAGPAEPRPAAASSSQEPVPVGLEARPSAAPPSARPGAPREGARRRPVPKPTSGPSDAHSGPASAAAPSAGTSVRSTATVQTRNNAPIVE